MYIERSVYEFERKHSEESIMNRSRRAYIPPKAAALVAVLWAAAMAEPAAAQNTTNYYFTSGSISWSGWFTDTPCQFSGSGSRTRTAGSGVKTGTLNFTDASEPLTIEKVEMTVRFGCWIPSQVSDGTLVLYINGKAYPYAGFGGGGCCWSTLATLDVTDYYQAAAPNSLQFWTNTGATPYITTIDGSKMVRFNVAYNPITTPVGFSSMTAPTVAWTAYGGATTYELQVGVTPLFNPPLFTKTGLSGTSYTLSGGGAELLTNGITYYARLRAEDGSDTAYHLPVDFTVDNTAPATPTLRAPAADATLNTTKPKFDWSPVTSGSE